MNKTIEENKKQIIERFYEDHCKNPDKYVILEDGRYALLDGKSKKILYTPPTYRQPTSEELTTAENEHREKVKKYENRMMDAVNDLYNFISINANKSMTNTELLDYNTKLFKLNKKVTECDNILFKKNHVLHDIIHFKSIPKNQILFEEEKDVRIIRDVYALTVRSLTLQEQYVRIAAGDDNSISENGIGEDEDEEKNIIVFSNPENSKTGWLCLKYRVSIIYNGKTFDNAWDAVYYSLAIKFGDKKTAQHIVERRKTEKDEKYNSTETATKKGTVEWEKELEKYLDEVNLIKFSSNKALMTKLLETGDYTLVSAEDPTNLITSAGIGADDPDIFDIAKWRGSNLYGRILENVRGKLKPATVVSNAYSNELEGDELEGDGGGGNGDGGGGNGGGDGEVNANDILFGGGGGGGNEEIGIINLNIADVSNDINIESGEFNEDTDDVDGGEIINE